MPTAQDNAELAKKRGAAAAQISDPEERRKFIAAQGDNEKKNMTSDIYDKLNREADNTLATSGANKAVNVYDDGGKVNVNDGKHEVAILKHGERVLTEKQNDKFEKTPMGKAIAAEDKMVGCYDKGGMCYDEGGTVHSPEEKAHFSRSMHKLHAGALHRHLGIAEGQPIPMDKKKAAASSDNPHVAAMGRLAMAMSGWKHPKK